MTILSLLRDPHWKFVYHGGPRGFFDAALSGQSPSRWYAKTSSSLSSCYLAALTSGQGFRIKNSSSWDPVALRVSENACRVDMGRTWTFPYASWDPLAGLSLTLTSSVSNEGRHPGPFFQGWHRHYHRGEAYEWLWLH